MADDSDNDDGVAQGAGDVAPAFDPAMRTLHASIQFYAQNQQYTQLRGVCERALAGLGAGSPQVEFWRCFALSKCGDNAGAIASLDALLARPDGAELGLPCVALLLSAHSAQPAKLRDKKALVELKTKLKVVSKQSGEAALLLAGRYFLASSKIPKARQCIEKLIGKNKKDVELLALFGWIYLESGEAKYEEKSMQVFKKAAKLSLPNFDIASLLGRAKYFECTSNLPKCLQSLDTLIKLYPSFLFALEEKLRLLTLSGNRWAEVHKLNGELRARRRAEGLGEGGAVAAGGAGSDSSIVMAFASTIESLSTSSGSGGRHTEAVRSFLQVCAREDGAATPNTFWSWQYAQIFARLARGGSGPTDAVLLQLADVLDTAIAAATASAGSKGSSLLTSLQFERAYVAYRRGEFERASAAFHAVAHTALASADKGEKEEGGEDAPPAKVNEDERFQRAQAHAHLVLVQLAQSNYPEAQALLEALPAEVAAYEPTPLPAVLYARAVLAHHHSKESASAVATLLTQYLQAHSQHLLAHPSPAQGVLGSSVASNGQQGAGRFFLHLDPHALVQAARLALAIVGVTDPTDPSASSRPTSDAVSTPPITDMLSLLSTSLTHLTSPPVVPGHAEALQLLTLVGWVQRDDTAAQAAMERVEALEGALPRVIALKRIVTQQQQQDGATAKQAASTAKTSSTSSSSKALPLASAALAAASSSSSSSNHPRGFGGREGGGAAEAAGLGFDDPDDDEDDAADAGSAGAMFKSSADAVGDDALHPAVASTSSSSAARTRLTRDEELEREAQAVLDEMEHRASALSAARAEEARQAALARTQLELDRRRVRDEEVRRLAVVEAELALEKTSKADMKIAELKRAEEIAALRAAREAEKKRQMEEIEKADREREEQREMERQERLRRRGAADASTDDANAVDGVGLAEVTPIQALGNDAALAASMHSPPPLVVNGQMRAPTGMKWNFPAGAQPAPGGAQGGGLDPAASPLASPLSLAHSPQGAYPASSPLSVAAPAMRMPSGSPISQQQPAPYPSGDSRDPTPHASPTSQPHRSLSHHPQHYAHSQAPTAASSPTAASASASASASTALSQGQQDEATRLAQEKQEKIAQAGMQIDQAKKFTKVAFWGEVFLKHGRRGSPHERNVTLEVTGSELKFDWSSGQLKAHKSAMTLVEGKGTPVFARATAAKSPEGRCFSIVTATRTLDLEAPSEQARDYWVTGIKLLLRYLK